MKLLCVFSFTILALCFCKAQEKKVKYDNREKFNQTILHLRDTFGKKYNIKEYTFEVKCIAENGDLTKLIKKMLDLGQFQYEVVEDGLHQDYKQYYSVFKIDQVKYNFETSSMSNYVNLINIISTLDRIVKANKPGYEYIFCNLEIDQLATLIFAKTSDLILAVGEGYPCSLDANLWYWGDEWPWGLFSEIEMEKISDFEDLKVNYYQTIKKLYEQGFNVAKLSIQRIYIDDIFERNVLDIVIDGKLTAGSKFVKNKIYCSGEPWSIVLAYTLVEHYGGKPTLYDTKKNIFTKLTPQMYLNKAEIAFGRRK